MSGVAAGDGRYVHAAVIYGSDEELVEIVVPHLAAGVAAGAPVVAVLGAEEEDRVRAAMNGAPPAVTFLSGLSQPAAAIKVLRSVADSVAQGADRARVVVTVPQPGLGAPWDGWCRCEAAKNDLLGDLPLWELCVYDRRITPAAVLADVERTHPHLVTVAGNRPSAAYEDPKAFMRRLVAPLDPLEAEPPAVELIDPIPASARRAVQQVAQRTRVQQEAIDDLVLATSEAVTNALKYGLPPVTLQIWAASERVLVTVSDCGEGPRDPYAGLTPAPNAMAGHGGFGLWLINQLTASATYTWDENGFTIHIVGGQALPLHR